MKTIKYICFILLFPACISYSQFEDILKKVPGVGDIFFEEAITTSIKDAYPTAYWLSGLDKNLSYENSTQFSLNLGAGYYRYRFNTFCLRAGTYEPTKGAGYLVAPIKGSKAQLIKNILGRYYEHPEISQNDVQLLLWGIEAGQKFSIFDAAFQIRVAPLLKPEEIALMEADVKDIAYDLLPVEAKDLFNLYSDIRGKLSNVNSTYEDVEKLAVKTGIAPLGKGSKNIDAGVWTSVGGKVYIRCYPEGYQKTEVEIFIPEETSISRDSQSRITEIKSSNGSLTFSYDATGISSAMYKNFNTGEEENISGTIDAAADKKTASELIQLIKKSFGKKRSKKITQQNNKEIEELSFILNYINNSSSGSSSKKLAVNSLFGYISSLEEKIKGSKGGSLSRQIGLGNISGMVFAPANTSDQRLGTGGPEGGNGNTGNEGDPPNTGDPKTPDKEEDKECKVKAYISQVNESELPKPDWVYFVNAEIEIDGNDDKCNAEEIMWTLYDVSKEKGRFMNDKEQYENEEEDLEFSNMNTDYNLTKTTATKQLSGKSQSHQIYIVCNDYGAYGKLKVSVKVKGIWYEAEADGTPDKFITIPLDLNENKIADHWEKQNNVYGKPGNWDEDPNPSGQMRPGDGMTNYEEYRGFMVSDGSDGTEYKRMNPLQKEIFVIDMDDLFTPVSWKAATGIEGYWMTPDLVFGSKGGNELNMSYRWVNFCRGNAAGSKYAVLLKRISTIDDPYKLCSNLPDYTGCNSGSPVKNAVLTLVLTERTKKWLVTISDTMATWLVKFPKEKQLKIGKHFIPTVWIKKFVDAVKNPAKLKEILNFYDNQIAIHEIGHALGVSHHGKDKNKTTGAHDCPMRYLEYIDPVYINEAWLIKVLDMLDTEGNLIVTYTKWKFCKTKDNCWKQLDAKDD